MALINAVESDEVPEASILAELETGLRSLAPALMDEARLAKDGAATPTDALGALARAAAASPVAATTPLEAAGVWTFTSDRDPSQTYRVAYGRAGHLECTCKGFEFRGACKHVTRVRGASKSS